MGRLEGRTAVVTGASRGIGAAVAERFAAEGARLLLAARSEADLQDVARRCGAAEVLSVDLAAAGSGQRVAEAVEARFGRLDALASIAGVLGGLAPVAAIERRGFEHALAVNAMANLELIGRLGPWLARSPAPRLVFATSGLSRRPFAGWATYAASKAALEALVLAYAAEAGDGPLRANLLDPGQVATALHREAFPDKDPASLKPPAAVADAFLALAEPACRLNGRILKASEMAEWCDWA